MSKILQTQLTGIFNRLEDQALDIQMAAQCLIKLLVEKDMYILMVMKFKIFETFILDSDEN